MTMHPNPSIVAQFRANFKTLIPIGFMALRDSFAIASSVKCLL